MEVGYSFGCLPLPNTRIGDLQHSAYSIPTSICVHFRSTRTQAFFSRRKSPPSRFSQQIAHSSYFDFDFHRYTFWLSVQSERLAYIEDGPKRYCLSVVQVTNPSDHTRYVIHRTHGDASHNDDVSDDALLHIVPDHFRFFSVNEVSLNFWLDVQIRILDNHRNVFKMC